MSQIANIDFLKNWRYWSLCQGWMYPPKELPRILTGIVKNTRECLIPVIWQHLAIWFFRKKSPIPLIFKKDDRRNFNLVQCKLQTCCKTNTHLKNRFRYSRERAPARLLSIRAREGTRAVWNGFWIFSTPESYEKAYSRCTVEIWMMTVAYQFVLFFNSLATTPERSYPGDPFWSAGRDLGKTP